MGVHTTIRDERLKSASDLVDRHFLRRKARYDPGRRHHLCPMPLAFFLSHRLLDTFPRHNMGWSMAHSLKSRIVLDTMNMAIGQHRPKDVIHPFDHRGAVYIHRLRLACKRPASTSPSATYGNGICEGFFAPPSSASPQSAKVPDQDRSSHGRLRIHRRLGKLYDPRH
mgnify:CR=1 FL=1